VSTFEALALLFLAQIAAANKVTKGPLVASCYKLDFIKTQWIQLKCTIDFQAMHLADRYKESNPNMGLSCGDMYDFLVFVFTSVLCTHHVVFAITCRAGVVRQS
jgi:hypothetical protein